jgi:hypothetical protein
VKSIGLKFSLSLANLSLLALFYGYLDVMVALALENLSLVNVVDYLGIFP